MKDLLGLMGKAKEMQAKFQAMQDEIATLEADGYTIAERVEIACHGGQGRTGTAIACLAIVVLFAAVRPWTDDVLKTAEDRLARWRAAAAASSPSRSAIAV